MGTCNLRCRCPFTDQKQGGRKPTGTTTGRASALEENTQQRRLVYYHGDVQGVGFRYTTRNAARAFQVTGFVQNLPDGRVYLACEGDCQELDAFLADIARRMADSITHLETSRETASGEFDQFEIRG